MGPSSCYRKVSPTNADVWFVLSIVRTGLFLPPDRRTAGLLKSSLWYEYILSSDQVQWYGVRCTCPPPSTVIPPFQVPANVSSRLVTFTPLRVFRSRSTIETRCTIEFPEIGPHKVSWTVVPFVVMAFSSSRTRKLRLSSLELLRLPLGFLSAVLQATMGALSSPLRRLLCARRFDLDIVKLAIAAFGGQG